MATGVSVAKLCVSYAQSPVAKLVSFEPATFVRSFATHDGCVEFSTFFSEKNRYNNYCSVVGLEKRYLCNFGTNIQTQNHWNQAVELKKANQMMRKPDSTLFQPLDCRKSSTPS